MAESANVGERTEGKYLGRTLKREFESHFTDAGRCPLGDEARSARFPSVRSMRGFLLLDVLQDGQQVRNQERPIMHSPGIRCSRARRRGRRLAWLPGSVPPSSRVSERRDDES